MTIRYGLIGATSVLEAQIRQLISQIGFPVGVWSDLFPDEEQVESSDAQLLMINGLRNFDDAMESTRHWAAKGPFEVVLLGDGQSPDRLKSAMRVGALDLIHPYRDADRLIELVKQLVGSVEGPTGVPGGEVIAVLGCRGGIGVTSLAVALSRILADDERNASVLVDLDQAHGDILSAINAAEGYTTQDLLNARGSLDVGKIRNAIRRQKSGLWVLPQPPEDLDTVTVTERDTAPLIEILRRAFTHVVVDMGVSFAQAGRAVCKDADKVVVLIDHEVVSMRTAVRRLKILQGLGLHDEQIFVVLNRYQSKRKPTWETIEDQIRHPLTATVAEDYDTAHTAMDKGVSVVDYAPRSELAYDLRYVKAQLYGEEIEKKKTGWWLRG